MTATGSTNTAARPWWSGCCVTRLPSDIVRTFIDDLEADLSAQVTDEVGWDVRMRTEPLRIDAENQVPLVNLSRLVRPKYRWDLLVCVTDLPRQLGTNPVVADISVTAGRPSPHCPLSAPGGCASGCATRCST